MGRSEQRKAIREVDRPSSQHRARDRYQRYRPDQKEGAGGGVLRAACTAAAKLVINVNKHSYAPYPALGIIPNPTDEGMPHQRGCLPCGPISPAVLTPKQWNGVQKWRPTHLSHTRTQSPRLRLRSTRTVGVQCCQSCFGKTTWES